MKEQEKKEKEAAKKAEKARKAEEKKQKEAAKKEEKERKKREKEEESNRKKQEKLNRVRSRECDDDVLIICTENDGAEINKIDVGYNEYYLFIYLYIRDLFIYSVRFRIYN